MRSHLRRTTMDPAQCTLLRVVADPETLPETSTVVDSLMGRRPELRFAVIQESARDVGMADLDI